MNEIKLTNSSVETVKMDTEFINWICPNPDCNNKNRTIEWDISNQELFCNKCHETVKYSWEQPNQTPQKKDKL